MQQSPREELPAAECCDKSEDAVAVEEAQEDVCQVLQVVVEGKSRHHVPRVQRGEG